MKQLNLFFLIMVMYSMTTYAATFTSVQSGNWNLGTTWNQGGNTPGADDDVVIASGHTVTINSTSSIAALTINCTNTDSYGTLVIATGAVLSTASHTIVYGKLYLDDGEFNEGNSSGDKLTINGSVIGSSCLISISGGILNISRYFALSNSSSFEMTGGIVNVNSKGGSSSTDIFNVPAGTTFAMSAGTINILNGNLGAGVALKYNPTTSTVTGGAINFTNVKGYESTTLVFDENLYNINSDVGDGDTLKVENMPNSSDGFSFNDFTITSGVTQVNQGTGITVNGTLTNNGNASNLVIESNISGDGSIIPLGSVVGPAVVERYIQAYTEGGNGWHDIGSPVDNMVIDGSDFDPGSTDDLYAWGESSNMWLNHKVSANNITNFTNGIGYLVAYGSTATKRFVGDINTSDITFTNLSVGDGGGWHLLGNPYPSALQWNNGDWTLSQISGVAKVWNESIGNYADIGANEYIPSTNGFFVQAVDGTNTIKIPASARKHNKTANFKSLEIGVPEMLIVNVSVDQNQYSDATTVGFNEYATSDWDIEYDSRKLFGSDEAPQLWTVSSGEQLSTNYLPYIFDSYALPLNFTAGVDGLHELTFLNTEGFYVNSGVELEDKFTGKFTNILETPYYSFEASKSDNDNRFVIHFYGITNIENETESNYSIYGHDANIYIKNTKDKTVVGNIKVYNALGQVVVNKDIAGGGNYSSREQLKSGYYLVVFQTNTELVTSKIVIN
ncbi:MAG: T9SS type A sorting domain-containing protein [Bacteroidetes bacterium]|nr:T9SS type A sorting domain-containing protein [Bacteroidota bacterium]